MKFNFKIQQYQTDAVSAVIDVFAGQAHQSGFAYRHDWGQGNASAKPGAPQQGAFNFGNAPDSGEAELLGYANSAVQLDEKQLLANIRRVQDANNIRQSAELNKALGAVSLDIEMETGTGKTYVYSKTMFELYKRYGWSKFIIVVPSIAIREGVKKSLEMTQAHFMEQYGHKARFFVYDSSRLNELDNFATNQGLNVMIINVQAFNSSWNEEKSKSARGDKTARIIYSRQEKFGWRRPIDVIKALHPIIILDEPQKMDGAKTQAALKKFNPLFALNYSATHKTQHNLVYVLDALDAYNKRLVKKIEVKGFEVQNLHGTDRYLFLERIIISKDRAPQAKLEFEFKQKNGIRRKTRLCSAGDDLYYLSGESEQYKGFTIADIEPLRDKVTFTNGEIIYSGQCRGDISEAHMRRVQIRETILSHFEKEEALFKQGIKTLSLFFIDEVSKYRRYDDEGHELLGEYGKIFEEEYNEIFRDTLQRLCDDDGSSGADDAYKNYLLRAAADVSRVHKGYFSIDKKSKRAINSKPKRGSEFSDDESAYELILRNKERLLSFEEPTRFIFSHSALREGWDNPNVFQICTLKHSDSSTSKRQEVGRGMRLCVDKDGNRMDAQACGDNVHQINLLTVIASESYASFVDALQRGKDGILENLHDRPQKAAQEYFANRTLTIDGSEYHINERQAKIIHNYLIRSDYIDDDDKVTALYKEAAAANTLKPLPEEVAQLAPAVHHLMRAIFDESVLKDIVDNARNTQITANPLNGNFYKEQFQELWRRINHIYTYTVSFDSEELIRKASAALNSELRVTQLQYAKVTGRQNESLQAHELQQGEGFTIYRSGREILQRAAASSIKYDLVGQIASGAVLTRRTAAAILRRLGAVQLQMFKYNPEEFISKTVKIISEQKAALTIEHIAYEQTAEKYDTSIFTAEKSRESFLKAFKAKKHIQDYVFTDGTAEKSVERRLAEKMDTEDDVCVYAKLPRGFKIPTPVGNYAPDWAIAFNEGKIKHIYFVAETKGSLERLDTRPIEKAKIKCAEKLFNKLSDNSVRYGAVTNYDALYGLVTGQNTPPV